jgi:phosphoglucosamine mutase
VADAQGRYIEFCKATVDSDFRLKGLKLVVDSAHGAAYQVAPAVFHELGAQVVSIGNAPNGTNINAGFGATAPAALLAAVQAEGADYGIALDGDADRLQLVDRAGRLFNGDELLAVLALDRVAQGDAVPGVVGTLMTNMGIELALARHDIALVRTQVGDRYVLEELGRRGWLLGGESSGHLLVLDRHSTGDGIVSALQVLHAVQRNGQDLAQLLSGIELFPQTMINVRLPAGVDWTRQQALAIETERVQAELSGQGRVLIRASGTEPVLRVMVEARDAVQARSAAERLAAAALLP